MGSYFENIQSKPERKQPQIDFFEHIIEEIRNSEEAYEKYRKMGIEVNDRFDLITINKEKLQSGVLNDLIRNKEILEKGDKSFLLDPNSKNERFLVFSREV